MSGADRGWDARGAGGAGHVGPDRPGALAPVLTRALEGILPAISFPGPVERAAAIPAEPGAYLLAIALGEPIDLCLASLERRAKAPLRLAAGWYVYAGSARGPGGLRARLSRHLQPSASGRLHWHVDHLTRAPGSRVWAAAFPESRECALVAALLGGAREAGPHPRKLPPAFTVPIPGFGSTDCRACPAHLLRWTGP